MTDKEKLIELLYDCPDCRMLSCGEIQRIADYILSHDVTIREKGEWTPYLLKYDSFRADEVKCSICNEVFCNPFYNFCPNCGADMRGENK